MKSIFKKKLKQMYKKVVINIFKLIYTYPKILNKNQKDSSIKEFKVKIDKNNYTIFQLKNGRVFTDSNDTTAYISDNNNLSNASLQYYKFDNINSYNNKISRNETLFIGTPKLQKKIKGKVLSLLSGGASKDNFTHWFTDVIPRLKIFTKKLKLKKIDKFYIPSLKYKYQIESLKMIGIDTKNIITSENFKHIRAKYIYATSHPCYHLPMNVKKWSLKFLRNSFVNKKKIRNCKKIFIDRDQFKLINVKNLKAYRNYRVLINEEEIKNYLISEGYTIIKPENFSFQDQIDIFSSARCIVGLYGAAMMMLSFCKKNTKVLEIKPTLGGNEFKNLSNLLKLKHRQINLKPIFKSSTPQNGLLLCPINKIKKQIKLLN